MDTIINQLKTIQENTLNEVIEAIELLQSKDAQNAQLSFTDNEWNDILLESANTAGVSVETLLEKLKAKNEYEQWLCDEAEEEYQQMMGAEDSVYGCDPYPEY